MTRSSINRKIILLEARQDQRALSNKHTGLQHVDIVEYWNYAKDHIWLNRRYRVLSICWSDLSVYCRNPFRVSTLKETTRSVTCRSVKILALTYIVVGIDPTSLNGTVCLKEEDESLLFLFHSAYRHCRSVCAHGSGRSFPECTRGSSGIWLLDCGWNPSRRSTNGNALERSTQSTDVDRTRIAACCLLCNNLLG